MTEIRCVLNVSVESHFNFLKMLWRNVPTEEICCTKNSKQHNLIYVCLDKISFESGQYHMHRFVSLCLKLLFSLLKGWILLLTPETKV